MITTTKTALIVVDVQNDFISGSLPVPDGEMVAAKIGQLMVSQHGREYDAIVTTQDWHLDPGDHFSSDPDFKNTWPVHCKVDTKGAELHWAVKDVPVDARFYKGQLAAAYSGFEGITQNPSDAYSPEGLGPWLINHGVTDVDVVGIATDFCVKATALDAQKLGFKTQVLLPYTAAVSPDGLATAIEDFKEAGVSVL